MKDQVTVLLVEDDKDDQYFFKQALAKISNAILFDVASNGQAALARLEHADIMPDIIFMDVNMPIMGGIECLAQMRMIAGIKNIPVIMLTTATDHAAEAKILGATAFIKKPNDGKLLREQMQQFIDLDYSLDGHIASQTFASVMIN